MTINPYQSPAVPDAIQHDEPITEKPEGPSPRGPMNAEDAYGVVVRSVGLVVSLIGLLLTAYAFIASLRALSIGASGGQAMDAVGGAMFFVVGIALIRCAPLVVSLSYASARSDDDD